MTFQNLVVATQKYFPDVKIKYKNQSTPMKILGKLMFFNPKFTSTYTTTLGNDIYFPSESFTKLHPVTCYVLLLHELVHVHDEKRLSRLVFSLSYAFPQILAIPAALLFLLTWKIALPVMLLLLLPLPAFWRTQYEKRAYMTSIYSMYQLGKTLNFDPHLDSQTERFAGYFKDSSYYFMWPFGNIKSEFDRAVVKIQNNQKPYQDDTLFAIIDDLIASCRNSSAS